MNKFAEKRGVERPPETAARLRALGWVTLGLVLAFSKPVFAWLQLGLSSDLQSSMLLVPLICIWLGRGLRRQLPPACSSAPAVAVLLAALGLVAMSAVRWLRTDGGHVNATDVLALRMLALVFFINGAAFYLLGVSVMRKLIFPAMFIIFMIPLPSFLEEGMEVFFQHASAHAASGLFTIAGTTVYRDGFVFKLPGILPIEVARECSGIRSSYALFLTSLVAGHLLLRRPISRVVLTVLVIPLGILRNGFRIFSYGILAMSIWPGVFDSFLHHRGGPVYFALSLIPFLGLLLFLRRRDMRVSANLRVHRPVEPN